MKIKAKSEPNGYLDLPFLFYVIVLILKNDRRATIPEIMLIRSYKPLVSLLNSCKNLSLKNFVIFYRVLVKKAWVSTYRKLNNGQKLKIRMRETSKVFNRIPLLTLVNNRTIQNDDRISLQKQTSNDTRQNNLTKLGITMLFDSEKVLLFDPKSFWRQEYSLTLWSRNLHIAWFYVFCMLFWRVSCIVITWFSIVTSKKSFLI